MGGADRGGSGLRLFLPAARREGAGDLDTEAPLSPSPSVGPHQAGAGGCRPEIWSSPSLRLPRPDSVQSVRLPSPPSPGAAGGGAHSTADHSHPPGEEDHPPLQGPQRSLALHPLPDQPDLPAAVHVPRHPHPAHLHARQ